MSSIEQFKAEMDASVEKLCKSLTPDKPAPKWPVGTWLVHRNSCDLVAERVGDGAVWRNGDDSEGRAADLSMEHFDEHYLPIPPRPVLPADSEWELLSPPECREFTPGVDEGWVSTDGRNTVYTHACTAHDYQHPEWGLRVWIARRKKQQKRGLPAWKPEYYPVEAEDVPACDALPHSLRKWTGMRAENLAKYGVRRAGAFVLIDDAGNSMAISDETCALCQATKGGHGYTDCTLCIGAKATGRTCISGGLGSPWRAWIKISDPEPMIAWLQEAVEKSKPAPLTGEAWLTANCTAENAGMMFQYKGEWFVVGLDPDSGARIIPLLRHMDWMSSPRMSFKSECFRYGYADLSDATVEVRPAPKGEGK